MKQSISLLLPIFLNLGVLFAQKIEKIPLATKDEWHLYVNDGQSNDLFYMQIVPKINPKGALVILPSGAERVEDTLKQIAIHTKAAELGLLVIVPSLNWGTSDRIQEFKMLDGIFEKVIQKYKVPQDKFVLGGLSGGGMIALKYAQQSVKSPGTTFLRPLGVFGVDTPLDIAHLYEYAEREVARDFSEAGKREGEWLLENYNKIYGGSPREYPDEYIKASIFSYGVENGGNAKYLKDMPVRMYTDLDVDWLINERRRDLNDWNGTNIVAMINQLRIMGNDRAHVVVSMGKGVRLDGTRHPHSWSILETEDFMTWIKDLL